jgi:hypothetical protein
MSIAMASTFPTPFPQAPPVTGPLPQAPINPLIGREQALDDLRAFLLEAGTRLLTLTGPGGSGKTRLAQQLAIDLQDDFRSGTRFITLASVTEPEHLLRAIATEVGVREEANRSLADAVAVALSVHELLLVLDNFEQLVDAAPAVSLLLSRSIRCRHWPCPVRIARSRSTSWQAVLQSRCSSLGHEPSISRSSWTIATREQSPTSVSVWMACRWRSSWRRRG